MSREVSPFQTFGEELRAARQAQHRSIDEIAQRTRINRKYIEAIESGDLGQLPTGPYTQAFLREYAKAVGCHVPSELAGVTIAAQPAPIPQLRAQPIARETRTEIPAPAKKATTARAGKTTPANAPLEDSGRSIGSGAAEQIGAAFRATKELPKLANQAAKTAARSAVRTTETVIKRVETGAKDAVDAITSKSLWEEAEQVRRERRGLPITPESESSTVRISNESAFDVRDIRSSVNAEQSREKPAATVGATAFTSIGKNPPAPELVALPDISPADISDSDISHSDISHSDISHSDTSHSDSPELAEEQQEASTPKAARTGIFSPTNVVIGCVVILFATVLAFALHLNKQDKTPAETAQTSDVAKEKPAKATPVVPPAKPVVTTPTIDSLRFVVRAISPVWVSIIPDGKNPFKGEMQAGETRSFSATDKFVVNLGNEHALEMTFNGQALSHLPTIANSGVVVRDLVLTRDHVSLGGQTVTLNNGGSASGQSASAQTAAAQKTPTKVAATPATPKSTAVDASKKNGASATATLKKPSVKSTPGKPQSKPKKSVPKNSGRRQIKNTIPPIDPLPARP